MKAVQINEHGGPERLKYQDVADLDPGPRDALLDMQAVGINYADVYIRAGNNPAAPLPRTIGMEDAGMDLFRRPGGHPVQRGRRGGLLHGAGSIRPTDGGPGSSADPKGPRAWNPGTAPLQCSKG